MIAQTSEKESRNTPFNYLARFARSMIYRKGCLTLIIYLNPEMVNFSRKKVYQFF